MRSPDRAEMEDRIASVAGDVEPLLDEFVFAGGVVTSLLVTDPAAVPVPVTDDVDVVVEVTTRVEYERINERLRALGLRHDTSEDAPICRWITPTDRLRLDVMDYVLEGTLLDASRVPGFVEEVRDRLERIATLTE